MIAVRPGGHLADVEEANRLVGPLAPAERRVPPAAAGAAGARNDVRLRALLVEHHGFVWRYLRRLGVPRPDVDDAVQRVFLVAASKLDRIAPGCERAFLCGTAFGVAANDRRARGRRRDAPGEMPDEVVDPAPRPDDLCDRARARALLDRALDALPLELRSVLVLHELEELTTPEIARLLQIPVGTAASRLRRAREAFRVVLSSVTAPVNQEGVRR